MYTLYKDGNEISADRDQLDALKADGWAAVKPEAEVVDEESDDNGADDASATGNTLESATTDEDADNRRLNLE
jgi:hypothetical protein